MSRTDVRVRGYALVEVLVPAEWTIPLDEIEEWATEGGDPFDLDSETVMDYVRAGDRAEYMAVFPAADGNRHGIETSDLVEIEILGTVTR